MKTPSTIIRGLFLLQSLPNFVHSRVSNWDIATCYQENQIIYAETNTRVVVSPNYPSSIPAGTNSCTYSLTARSSDSVITIDWKSFNLKQAPNCNQQKIIIIDELASNRVGPFCGSEARSFTSSGDKLKIQFISSDSAQGSMFAFSFVAMDKMQMTQARSAFDAFDRARMGGSRGPRLQQVPGGQFNSFNNGGSIDNALAAFDNIRNGRPINAAPLSSSSAASIIPTGRPLSSSSSSSSTNEPALISSSGIRLGSAIKEATKTSSKYNPENEAVDTENNNLNSHLKVVGQSDPKIFGNYQAKRTLKRYKDVGMAGIAQLKGSSQINDEFFSRNNQDQEQSSSFGKTTYRTEQEFQAAIEQEKNQEIDSKISSIGPSRTDSISSSSSSNDNNANNPQPAGPISTADSTRKSGILLSDRFIPSSFISRGAKTIEGNTYLIKERTEGKLSDNEAMRDPIKEFFLEWNITKIFIAGLIGLILLLILVAFCRWRFNVWLQRREALRNSKLVQEVHSKSDIANIISASSADMPTYKSVLKSIANRDEQSQIEKANHPENGSSSNSTTNDPKLNLNCNSEPIYIINSSNHSQNSSTPSCPITTSSDVPLSIKTSQTYIPGAVALPIPISKIESMNNAVSHNVVDNFVDPNGVNPALEREKSRKHFLENQSQNNRSRHVSRDNNLDSNVNYAQKSGNNIPTFLPAQDLTRNVTLIRNGSVDVNSAYPQHNICPTTLPLPEVPSNSSKLANISSVRMSGVNSGSSTGLINR